MKIYKGCVRWDWGQTKQLPSKIGAIALIPFPLPLLLQKFQETRETEALGGGVHFASGVDQDGHQDVLRLAICAVSTYQQIAAGTQVQQLVGCLLN
jgi:hypothetical protein